jgi:hypothetical protein
MKTQNIFLTLSLSLFALTSCDTTDPVEPVDPIPGAKLVVVNSNITSNTTWYSDTTYQLGARVSVESGATLTIQPGTVIKGEAGSGANATAFNFSSERTSYYQITDNLIKVIDPSGNFYHVDSRGIRHGEFEPTKSIDRMTNITVKGQMNNGNYIGKVFHLLNGQLALIRVYDQNGNLTKTTRIHDMNAISRSIAQK